MRKSADYQRRVNAVIDHVAKDPLRPHTVEELAAVSNFSKFHFHRVFCAVSGETVSSMVTRLRLDAAAASLIYKPTTAITEIALDHGYSSSANFAKAFSKHFGCSPSNYRMGNMRAGEISKIGKARSAVMRDDAPTNWLVETVTQEEISLAFLRRVGAYEHKEISEMYAQLQTWIDVNECGAEPPQSIGITWSDSHIAAEETWRYDACMAVRPKTRGDTSVGIQTLPARHVAQLALTLPHTESRDLSVYWDWLLGVWLPASGEELAHCPSYEIYDNAADADHFAVRLCLPLVNNTQESTDARR